MILSFMRTKVPRERPVAEQIESVHCLILYGRVIDSIYIMKSHRTLRLRLGLLPLSISTYICLTRRCFIV